MQIVKDSKKDRLKKAKELLKVELVKPDAISATRELLYGHDQKVDQLLDKASNLAQKYGDFKKAYEKIAQPSFKKSIPLGKIELSFEVKFKGLEKVWEKTIDRLKGEINRVYEELSIQREVREEKPPGVEKPKSPFQLTSLLTSKIVLVSATIGVMAIVLPIFILSLLKTQSQPSKDQTPSTDLKPETQVRPQVSPQKPIEQKPGITSDQSQQGYFVLEEDLTVNDNILIVSVHVHKGTVTTYRNEIPATGAKVSGLINFGEMQKPFEAQVSGDGWARSQVEVMGNQAKLYLTEVLGELPWLNRAEFVGKLIDSWSR